MDTSKYTIFLINWYGRPDFVNHVYLKTNEPDPDTGYNFGENRHSRKMIAWGGTTSDDEEGGPASTARVWFYDLSAGPESCHSIANRQSPIFLPSLAYVLLPRGATETERHKRVHKEDTSVEKKPNRNRNTSNSPSESRTANSTNPAGTTRNASTPSAAHTARRGTTGTEPKPRTPK